MRQKYFTAPEKKTKNYFQINQVVILKNDQNH